MLGKLDIHFNNYNNRLYLEPFYTITNNNTINRSGDVPQLVSIVQNFIK